MMVVQGTKACMLPNCRAGAPPAVSGAEVGPGHSGEMMPSSGWNIHVRQAGPTASTAEVDAGIKSTAAAVAAPGAWGRSQLRHLQRQQHQHARLHKQQQQQQRRRTSDATVVRARTPTTERRHARGSILTRRSKSVTAATGVSSPSMTTAEATGSAGAGGFAVHKNPVAPRASSAGRQAFDSQSWNKRKLKPRVRGNVVSVLKVRTANQQEDVSVGIHAEATLDRQQQQHDSSYVGGAAQKFGFSVRPPSTQDFVGQPAHGTNQWRDMRSAFQSAYADENVNTHSSQNTAAMAPGTQSHTALKPASSKRDIHDMEIPHSSSVEHTVVAGSAVDLCPADAKEAAAVLCKVLNHISAVAPQACCTSAKDFVAAQEGGGHTNTESDESDCGSTQPLLASMAATGTSALLQSLETGTSPELRAETHITKETAVRAAGPTEVVLANSINSNNVGDPAEHVRVEVTADVASDAGDVETGRSPSVADSGDVSVIVPRVVVPHVSQDSTTVEEDGAVAVEVQAESEVATEEAAEADVQAGMGEETVPNEADALDQKAACASDRASGGGSGSSGEMHSTDAQETTSSTDTSAALSAASVGSEQVQADEHAAQDQIVAVGESESEEAVVSRLMECALRVFSSCNWLSEGATLPYYLLPHIAPGLRLSGAVLWLKKKHNLTQPLCNRVADAVLDVRGFSEATVTAPWLKCQRVYMGDIKLLSTAKTKKFVRDMIYSAKALRTMLAKHERVLVMCHQGINRSCGCIATYAMLEHNLPPRAVAESIRQVKAKSNWTAGYLSRSALRNETFLNTLQNWYDALVGKFGRASWENADTCDELW